MKNIYALLAFITTGQLAVSQCNSTIPSTSIVVNANQTVTANNGYYWVCSGSLNITGNGNTLFVEEDAGASVTGTNNTINTKDIIVSQSDDGNGSNIIYADGFDDVISTNFNDQINGCSAVSFNYSNAPANGCAGGTGIEELVEPILLHVFPNPMHDVLELVVDNVSQVDQVSVIDVAGREVLRRTGDHVMRLDVSSLPTGSYTVIIQTDRGLLTRQVWKDR